MTTSFVLVGSAARTAWKVASGRGLHLGRRRRASFRLPNTTVTVASAGGCACTSCG